MVADHHYHRADRLREILSQLVSPLQKGVDGVMHIGTGIYQSAVTHQKLVQENEQLKNEKFIQSAKLQKLIALEAENNRLRSLLKSTPRVGENLLVAEIIQVDSDPLNHRVLLNKGSKEGVYIGQPVIDEEGIMGEVTEVFPKTCRILLVTDANHGVPVENVRNGVRGVVMGNGKQKTLSLKHVSNPVDMKTGDVLVTSGLEGRYPSGYPVGVISQVKHDASEPFPVVDVKPCAHLERGRQVLLVQKASNG